MNEVQGDLTALTDRIIRLERELREAHEELRLRVETLEGELRGAAEWGAEQRERAESRPSPALHQWPGEQ